MADITVRSLAINGIKMPTPALKGVTITRNKIWSTDTGRTASGKMVGTILAIKDKITIQWPPLTEEQAAVIEAAVSDPATPFSTMQYTDMQGNTVTRTVYFSDPSYTQSSWCARRRCIQDVRVDAIEQ